MKRILFAIGAASLLATSGTLYAAPHGGGRPSGGHSSGFSPNHASGFAPSYRPSFSAPNHAVVPYYGGVPYRTAVPYSINRGFYGNGYGYGYGYPYGGLSISLWYSNSGYYAPFSTRSPYSTTTIVDPNFSQYSAVPPKSSGEWGLKITEVLEGSAKTADLRAGDVILGVGPTRTQTFEELQRALSAGKDTVDIIFINGETKKVEKLPVKPSNGKIGIAVVPIDLP